MLTQKRFNPQRAGYKHRLKGIVKKLREMFQSPKGRLQTYDELVKVAMDLEFQSPKGRLQTSSLYLGIERVEDVSIPKGQATNVFQSNISFVVAAVSIPKGQATNPSGGETVYAAKALFQSPKGRLQTRSNA